MKITEIKTIDELLSFFKNYTSYIQDDTEIETKEDFIKFIHYIQTDKIKFNLVSIETDDFITLAKKGITTYCNVRLIEDTIAIISPLRKHNNISYDEVYKQLIKNNINFIISDRQNDWSKKLLNKFNIAGTRLSYFTYNNKVISDDWINSSNEVPKKMRKMLRDIENGAIRYDVYNIKDTPENILNQFYRLSKEWSKNKKDKGLYVSGTVNYFEDIMVRGGLGSLSIYTIPLTYNNELISLSVVEVLNNRIAFYSEYRNAFQVGGTIPSKYINNAGSLKYYIPIKALIDKGIVSQDFQLLDEDGGEDSFTKIYNKEFEALSPLTRYKLKHNPLYMRPLYIATGINNKRSIF